MGQPCKVWVLDEKNQKHNKFILNSILSALKMNLRELIVFNVLVIFLIIYLNVVEFKIDKKGRLVPINETLFEVNISNPVKSLLQ